MLNHMHMFAYWTRIQEKKWHTSMSEGGKDRIWKGCEVLRYPWIWQGLSYDGTVDVDILTVM